MVQTSEVRVGRDATDGLNSTLDVATGQPRGAPMKHGGRVLGALFDKAEARMLSLGFIQLYVLVIVRLARRELVWINVTAHPTAEWIAQQLTEAFPWNEVPRYLIRDRDAVYGAAVTRRLRVRKIITILNFMVRNNTVAHPKATRVLPRVSGKASAANTTIRYAPPAIMPIASPSGIVLLR
jgi:hypothetical protein